MIVMLATLYSSELGRDFSVVSRILCALRLSNEYFNIPLSQQFSERCWCYVIVIRHVCILVLRHGIAAILCSYSLLVRKTWSYISFVI